MQVAGSLRRERECGQADGEGSQSWREAQPMFTKHISTDEFRSRREKLCCAIDNEGIVLVQGAPEAVGNSTFAQHKDFLYLCGLESPRAYLLIEGKDAHTTLYLQHRASVPQESPKPSPCAENADYVKDLTGVESVRGVEELGEPLSRSFLVYTPFHSEIRSANRPHAVRWAVRLAADPWDTGITRSAQFIETIKRQFPQLHIVDLVPFMDELRLIKVTRGNRTPQKGGGTECCSRD